LICDWDFCRNNGDKKNILFNYLSPLIQELPDYYQLEIECYRTHFKRTKLNLDHEHLEDKISEGLHAVCKPEELSDFQLDPLSINDALTIIDFLELPSSTRAYKKNFDIVMKTCKSYPLLLKLGLEDSKKTLFLMCFEMMGREKDEKDRSQEGHKFKEHASLLLYYLKMMNTCKSILKYKKINASFELCYLYDDLLQKIKHAYIEEIDEQLQIILCEDLIKIFKNSSEEVSRQKIIFENNIEKTLYNIVSWVYNYRSLEISSCTYKLIAKLFKDPVKKAIAVSSWTKIMCVNEEDPLSFTIEELTMHIEEHASI